MVPSKNFLQLETILRELQSCLISHWGSWRSFSSLVFVLCFFCGLVVGSFYINTTNFTGFGHLYLFHAVPIFSTFNICELYRKNLLSLVQNLTFKARCEKLVVTCSESHFQSKLIKWIEFWLCGRTQTIVVIGTQSSPVIVTSGVPHGIVLGPLMFLLYINDIGLQITSEFGLFADDSVLYGVVNMVSSAEVLQSDLNKLVVWSEK